MPKTYMTTYSMNEPLLLSLLGILFIHTVYLIGKFVAAILLGVHDEVIFIGYGKHKAFKLRLRKLTIYVGLFIPLPFLARFYKYTEGVKQPITYEWEFFEKPWISRMAVIFGGSLSSLIVSMIIYSALAFQEVDTYLSKDELNTYGIFPSIAAREKGLRKGDRILAVNGEDYQRFSDLMAPDLLLGPVHYHILRGQDTIDLTINWMERPELVHSGIITPNAPVKITSLVKGEPAMISGLVEGDVITNINGRPVSSLLEISEVLEAHAEDTPTIQFTRKGLLDSVRVNVLPEGKIGFYAQTILTYESQKRSVLQSIASGVTKPFELLRLNIKGFAKMVGGGEDKSGVIKTSGPIRIASLFGGNNVANFFRITAVLLITLVFWDIMPFPKSSLFKAVPVVVEVIFKKKVSLNRYHLIHKISWSVIVFLMVAVLISDTMLLF